nr:hypothetical protein [Tsuneonella amylolytica]
MANIALEQRDEPVGLQKRGGCEAFGLALRAILLSHLLERVPSTNYGLNLRLSLLPRRIAAASYLDPRLVPPKACLLEGGLRICAEAELLLLALGPVFESPEFGAARSDQQVESISVRQLPLFIPRNCLPNLKVSQCHWGPHLQHSAVAPLESRGLCRLRPPKAPNSQQIELNANGSTELFFGSFLRILETPAAITAGTNGARRGIQFEIISASVTEASAMWAFRKVRKRPAKGV